MSMSNTTIWFLLLALVCVNADELGVGTDGVLTPEAVFNESNPHRWTDPHDRIVGVRCPDGHSEPIGGIEADTGEMLFKCGNNVAVWSIVTGEFRISLGGHTGHLTDIATRKDVVVASGSANEVRAWSLTDGRSTHNWTWPRDIDGSFREITCIAIGSDIVFAGTNSGSMVAWDHRTGELLWSIVLPLDEPRVSITCMWASVDDRQLLFGLEDGRIRKWTSGFFGGIRTIYRTRSAVWYVTKHLRLDVIGISTREDVLIFNTSTGVSKHRKPGSASAVFFDGDDTFIWQGMQSRVLTLSSIHTGEDVGEMSSFPVMDGRDGHGEAPYSFVLARRHESVILMPDVRARDNYNLHVQFALVECDCDRDCAICWMQQVSCVGRYYYFAMAMKRGHADGEMKVERSELCRGELGHRDLDYETC